MGKRKGNTALVLAVLSLGMAPFTVDNCVFEGHAEAENTEEHPTISLGSWSYDKDSSDGAYSTIHGSAKVELAHRAAFLMRLQ